MSTTLDSPPGELGQGTGFVVALEGFIGPLDLLLHLVREEQIDIADIPVARIADQFLRIIHSLGLNQAADYLEMAGRLIRLKAQLLLPRRTDDEEWIDPRAELVRRLLEYQQIKEIALQFARLAERRALRCARGYLPPPAAPLPPLPLTIDLLDLLVAVERVVTNIPFPVLHSVVTRPLEVESAVLRIEVVTCGAGLRYQECALAVLRKPHALAHPGPSHSFKLLNQPQQLAARIVRQNATKQRARGRAEQLQIFLQRRA